MTKLMMAALLSATVLAGCNKATTTPGAPPPASAAELRAAEKLVDAGALIPLDDQTLQQIAIQQVQGMMQQNNLAPQEAEQLMFAIVKDLKAAAPELKKKMVGNLTDQFTAKEMEFLLKWMTSKEGEAIRAGINPVGEKSNDQITAEATVAGNKALAQLKAAWPLKPPPAPPAPTPEPVKPGAKPAPAKAPATPQPPRPN